MTNNKTKVLFYKPDEINDELLKYAVIASRYKEKWVFCRHKKRPTWEIPGGHREPGEAIDKAAARELWEETGAADAEIYPISAYSVEKDGEISYAMLYFAAIKEMDERPEFSEMAEIRLFDAPPDDLTYPDIQPQLYSFAAEYLNNI